MQIALTDGKDQARDGRAVPSLMKPHPSQRANKHISALLSTSALEVRRAGKTQTISLSELSKQDTALLRGGVILSVHDEALWSTVVGAVSHACDGALIR